MGLKFNPFTGSLDNTGAVSSVNGQIGAVVLTKTDVGLGNVDNTSDANKPVSTAQAAADALAVHLAGNETITGKKSWSSTSNGLELYNTTDQTTNYERARHYWTGNAYTISTELGGTGTQRAIKLQGPTTGFLQVNATSSAGFIQSSGSSSQASSIIHLINGTMTASSGTQYGLSHAPTINQTLTAGYAISHMDVTETSVGSGLKNLADWRVGGVSKFSVDNTGNTRMGNGVITNGWSGFTVATPTSLVDVAGSQTARSSIRIRSGVAPTTPNDGDIWYDGTNLKMQIAGVTKTFTLT